MKFNITKLFAGVLCATSMFSMTSCLDETFPTSAALENQVQEAGAKGTEALMWAMPAFLNNFNTQGSEAHYDWGYGAIMHIRDVMTGDMTVVASSYDWFSSWAQCTGIGESTARAQFIWNYYYKFIKTANSFLATVDTASVSTDAELGMIGVAHAYRALAYLDAAQMFEFLPNEKLDTINLAGNNVHHLTIPIITENTTEKDARNNPRATREDMAEFILADLDAAEALIDNHKISSKVIPHLDAVYGLKARCYMWLADYENAKKYARLAIDNNTGDVMSRQDCLSTTSGFNDPSKWMWASTTQKEDDVVGTGIINWASWMSPEAQYGYSAAGATSMIDAMMYHRIKDTDFRKLMYKAPEDGELVGKEIFIDEEFAANLPEYAMVKFRPNAGNTQEYSVGSSTSYPLMRIEEMYFIEAEAAEHIAPGEGVTLLTDFMTTYRDEKYTVNSSVSPINEIVFQKRVELLGEGLSFFDYKRLDMDVTRNYEGTNVDSKRAFNTTGRPAWMNFCIVITEKNNNAALKGFENDDPSGLYK
ncbi:MAG: RagB/SusD family nutrient uptake outer membrane protein [Bacteroidaceae bacterium]|nr:RagB/SusD family nutrient uptake outer membrane protein [Bacteroidaceae bacterium]